MSTPIRKILMTTDLSPSSWAALPMAQALRESFGAELVVLSIVEEPIYFSQVGFEHPAYDWIRQTEPVVRERIENHLKEEGIQGVEVHTVRAPDCGSAVVEQARDMGADMIVMATHGRTGLLHLLLGSVAEKVLRTSPIPVTTVRATEDHDASE